MFWLHRLSPANRFKEYFELVQANSQALKDEVFRLRHRVYCEELGFERPTFDGRERDAFDEHSRHLLLRSVKTGDAMGCIRLVTVPPDRPRAPLPFEKVCAATIDRREFDPDLLPRHSIAEISRLALAPEFRRRRDREGSTDVAHRDYGRPVHPKYPYVQLGLYLGAIALAEDLGIETLFLLTEPRLLAHFRRLGFPLRQVGRPVEHRGWRVLSVGEVGNPVARLPFFMRPLYRMIAREIDEDQAARRRERGGVVSGSPRLTGQIGPGRAGARPAFFH
jgi:N-acyl amino acid synthase of PEP-CTERM/exosortase system